MDDFNWTNVTKTTVKNSDAADKIILLQNIEQSLWRYGTPLLFVVGLMGNLLTILVLRR